MDNSDENGNNSEKTRGGIMANKSVKTYVVAGNLVWQIVTPLLLCIGGGSWLCGRFNLPDWAMLIFVFLGIGSMIIGVAAYLKRVLSMYKSDNSEQPAQLKADKSDYDY